MDEKQEIRDFIIWYLTNTTDKKTAKDYKLLEKYIKEELDVTEALIRENAFNDYVKRKQMMTEIFRAGRGADLALAEAEKELCEGLFFLKKEYQLERKGYEWEKADEDQLIDWLFCRTDTPPAVIPARLDSNYLLHHDYMEEWFAAMTYVCDFPVRYCAHTLYNGITEHFKYPFRSLILYREEGYADAVLARMKEILSADFKMDADEIDATFMKAFASVYCGGTKKKQETAYYQAYIDGWMETDRERFLAAIRTIWSLDLRKKVLKKLTGSAK